MVLRSSHTIQSRDIGNDDTFQFAPADSAELEMVRAQNQAIEMEKLLADFDEQVKKAKNELRKKNEDVVRL